MIDTINSEPARLPQKVTNQWISIFHHDNLRWRTATVVNYCALAHFLFESILTAISTMKEPVHRSAPVKMIMHNPYGKTKAAMVRMRPGALSWNQGVVLVLRTVPQAKASRHPADTELKNTLSSRILPFWTPALAIWATTSAGV
jgi:hypothetical protein